MKRRLTLCAVAFGVPAAAAAQSPRPSPSPSPPPVRSEYVEVTATRIPEDAAEVPASIEVVTGQELEDRGATDLRSALALATGLDIAPGGDEGPASFVPEFWGLKEFDAFLLVVDGVPRGGAFNPALTTLDLQDVDRIEVLRGAAPVMYGATSFVGVIHVVHKDAGAGRRRFQGSLGSYASGGASAVLPFGWAGFRSTLEGDGGRTGFRDDRTSYRRGHVLWRNARGLGRGRLHVDADAHLVDQDPASPHVREGRTLSARAPRDANHDPAGAFLNDRRVTVNAGYERPMGAALWVTTVSFGHGSNHAFRGFLADLDDPRLNARGIRENIAQTDLYADTHLQWSASPRVSLVAGLDHIHGEGKAQGVDFDYLAPLDGSFAPPVAEPTVLDARIEDRREFSGLYGFAEWHPAPKWRVEGGLRLNRTAEEREGGEAGGTGPGEGADRVTHVRLSGSAGVSWTAWARGEDLARVFANYRATFKPAAIDFGIEAPESPEGRGILEPETARSYEAGVRARAAGGRLGVDVAAFLMDFENLVVAQSVNGLPALANAGTQRFQGVEAGVSLRLRDRWRARASYSLHDSRFRDYVTLFDGVATQLGGKRLEMVARHLASAGLYRAPVRGLTAGAEVNWVGSRFLNKRNTAPAEGYAVVSASLGWRQGPWDLRVDGRNLGDRRDPVAESELGDAQYYLLPARRVDFSASLRF